MTDPTTGADQDFARRVGALTGEQRELLDRLLDEPMAERGETWPAEKLLAEIWADCLEIESVGLDEDYFQLGGDSITAIMIVARATTAGLHLSAHDIFEQRTVRRLASVAADPLSASPNGDRTAARHHHDEFGLTPVQQGMLFHVLADPRGTAYLAHASCVVTGTLDPRALVEACVVVVRRHAALRTSFRWNGPEPRQAVAATATIPVDLRDLRALTGPDRDGAVADYLAADRARPFDLTVPPLLRIGLLRVADSSWVVSLAHHHLVLDGWSQQLLLSELLDVMDDAPGTEPAAEFDFARYVTWSSERDSAASEAYWRRALAGFVPVPLATAGARPAEPGTVATTVDPRIGRAVAALARARGLTLGAVLYGGWALTLSVLTGARDVCFGATVAGRPALSGATAALGNFVATLPLRLTINEADGVVAWLTVLQQQRTALDEHQHTPLTRIGRLSSGPPFDSIAVVENFPQLIGERSGGLTISEVRATIDEGYPVVLEAHPGPPIVLRIRADRTRFDSARATLALRALSSYLDELAARPDSLVRDVSSAMRAAVRRDAGRASGLLAARRQSEAGDG